MAGRSARAAIRRIGVLMGYPEGDADAQSLIAAFQQEFQKLGWRPDQNVRFEYRWATSNVELMQRYAKELVALAPDLILSSGTPTTAALVQQTSTIPIGDRVHEPRSEYGGQVGGAAQGDFAAHRKGRKSY